MVFVHYGLDVVNPRFSLDNIPQNYNVSRKVWFSRVLVYYDSGVTPVAN